MGKRKKQPVIANKAVRVSNFCNALMSGDAGMVKSSYLSVKPVVIALSSSNNYQGMKGGI